MKRLAASLIAIALLAPLPSRAQVPTVQREQSADAIWMVPTEKKGHYIGYYALAMLDEPGGGDFSLDQASVGKGRCVRKKSKNMTSTMCMFTGWASGKASEHFTMDPLLQTAELNLQHKGKSYRVAWTGGDFSFYSAAEGCFSSDDEEPREGQGGGFLRFARAEAHIFGEHLLTKGRYSAMLMSGAMVTECARAELAGLQPGERLRITL